MTDGEPKFYFDDLCDLFDELGAHNPPAELHGILTGQLCAGVRMSDQQWLKKALEFMDVDNPPGVAAQRELFELYHYTAQLLEEVDNIFYPLLPDDDDLLSSRMLSLSQWCGGFLAGFALVEQNEGMTQYPAIVSDALKDLASISRTGRDVEDEPDAQGEQDYAEIVEYVRLVAMNIYLELGVKDQLRSAVSGDNAPQIDKPLH